MPITSLCHDRAQALTSVPGPSPSRCSHCCVSGSSLPQREPRREKSRSPRSRGHVSVPQGIVVASDGVAWFAEQSANAIGSLSNGIFSRYPLPTAGSAPFSVTIGADGNIWFTERLSNRIGKITPTGVITEYPIPTAGSRPGGSRRTRRCPVVHRTGRQPDRADHHRG